MIRPLGEKLFVYFWIGKQNPHFMFLLRTWRLPLLVWLSYLLYSEKWMDRKSKGTFSSFLIFLFACMPSMKLDMPVNVPDNMPHLSSVKAWFHIGQAVLTILVICVIAPVIATEIKFYVRVAWFYCVKMS